MVYSLVPGVRARGRLPPLRCPFGLQGLFLPSKASVGPVGRARGAGSPLTGSYCHLSQFNTLFKIKKKSFGRCQKFCAPFQVHPKVDPEGEP